MIYIFDIDGRITTVKASSYTEAMKFVERHFEEKQFSIPFCPKTIIIRTVERELGVCDKCGLPPNLCVCDDIKREKERMKMEKWIDE